MNVADELVQIRSQQAVMNFAARMRKRHLELEVLNCLFDKEERVAQKAAWVLEHLVKQDFVLPDTSLASLMDLQQRTMISGLQRALMFAFSRLEIEEKNAGDFLQVAERALASSEVKVAVKVHAMELYANVLSLFPELFPEFKALLNVLIPLNSVAFEARARKVLQRLKRDGFR